MIKPAVIKPEAIKPEIPTKKGGKLETVERGSKPIEESPLSQPIEDYEHEEEKPYIVEYFDLNIPYYSVEEDQTKRDLEAINEFVKDQLVFSKKKLDLESYDNYMLKLKEKLGIEDDLRIDAAIERIAGFVDAYNEISILEKKSNHKKFINRIVYFAKGKDFDRDTLSLLIQDEYIKWLNTNQ